MAILRTTFLALACLCASVPTIEKAAAEAYPSRMIKMIVPFPAGGVLDAITRAVTERLKDRIGQSVIVENRAGAGGTIGLEACAKAAPDGYTLCSVTIEQMSTRAHLDPDQFERYKELAPITQLVGSKGVILANPELGIRDIDGLVRMAKERSGKLNYASFGWGSSPHLVFEWLNTENGIDLYHVPQKSAGHMITEILGGRMDASYVTVGFAKPYVDAGKIQPLAVLGRTRSALLPDVPSFAELGLDFPYEGGWFALMGPPGIDKAVLDKIVTAVCSILADSDFKQKFLDPQGYVAIGNTPDEFAAILKNEIKRFESIAKIVQAKPGK